MDVAHLRMQERRFTYRPGDSFLLRLSHPLLPSNVLYSLNFCSCSLIHQFEREFTTSPSTCSVAALLYISLCPSFCMRCFFFKHNNPHQNVFQQLSEPLRKVPIQLQHPPNRKPEASPSPSSPVSRRESTATTRELSSTTAVSKLRSAPALWRFARRILQQV